MKSFAPFEVALEDFYCAGGARVTVICAPAGQLLAFRQLLADDGSAVDDYFDTPIELAFRQTYVSIRGTSVSGQPLEIPLPSA